MTERSREDRILDRLLALYVAGAPFREDRDHAEELRVEAKPVLNTLLRSMDAPGDVTARGEALAMLTLFGRRAGTLGVTPTAALSLVAGLETAMAEEGVALVSTDAFALRAMASEGYVKGREERRDEERAVMLAEAHRTLTLAPRVAGLVLSGDMDAPRLQRLLDRFGRDLLRLDMLACVVDMSGLLGPAADRASEVFAADGAARMLGGRAFFSGASEAWLGAAREGRVPLEVLHIRPTFAAALEDALRYVGLRVAEVPPEPWWKRLVARRR